MKRIVLIVAALVAIMITVDVLRRPTALDPNALAPATGPAAGARTIDLGDGWSADVVVQEGDLVCVVIRSDVVQTSCLAANGGQIWTSTGQGQRVTFAAIDSVDELTAQFSSREQSGGPCCRPEDSMVEIVPDVWLAHFATEDDDEHWGVQLRLLDGALYRDHSLVPVG